MNIDILCSSRELFGADRSALRLAGALRELGLEPELVLPADRPERGLHDEARSRGVAVREERIAIASSGGVESAAALRPRRRTRPADLTVFNTTAVLGSARPVAKKVVVVREWLDPRSARHRLLALRHRIGCTAIVGVSSDVVRQWRRCVRGPARQYVVHNWLEGPMLAAADPDRRPSAEGRDGILCIGRFNGWKGQGALADAYEEAFGLAAARPTLTFLGAQPGTDFDRNSESIATRGDRYGWRVLPFTEDPTESFLASSLVAVPSLQPEPFGTVILEAIANGCRVVAFTGGGPSDLADLFPGAITVVPRHERSLADALRGWWDGGGSALSAEESRRAAEILNSGFSPAAGARAWRPIVDAIAAARP